MKSLWSKEARDEVGQRVGRLRADSERRWGTLGAGQAVCHLSDQLRLALGDLPEPTPVGPFRFRPLAYALIHWLPWPKGVESPDGAFTTAPEEFERDRRQLLDLIERFPTRPRDDKWPAHGSFGPLDADDWGVLSYRHLDHHLRQFGV